MKKMLWMLLVESIIVLLGAVLLDFNIMVTLAVVSLTLGSITFIFTFVFTLAMFFEEGE